MSKPYSIWSNELNFRLIRAYSLTEVLILILILSALLSLLLPIFESSRNNAKYAVCTLNMKQIYHAVSTESISQMSGLLPPDPYKWEIYAEVLLNSPTMICPSEVSEHYKTSELYEFIPPPSDISLNALESDEKVFVFREQSGIRIDGDLDVINQVGRYGAGYSGGGNCGYTNNGKINHGSLVDVYYFSYDPATTHNQGSQGQIMIDDNSYILGVIAKSQYLHDTDSKLGLDIFYPNTIGCRGLEGCMTQNNFGDVLEINEDRQSITHRFSRAGHNACKDDFRVITSLGSSSSYAMNVEIKPQPTWDSQILLTDAKVPWIDFQNGKDEGEFTFEETFEPRHFGKINVLNVDGTVQLIEIDKLKPDFFRWRGD